MFVYITVKHIISNLLGHLTLFCYMTSCAGKQITEVRRLMTGVEGSVVELRFVGLRNGKKETVSVSLNRQPPPKTAR